MKKMEIFLLLVASFLAVMQVGVTHWSKKIGSENAKKELKKDLTKVFKELNEVQREKFISDLDLNKEEILLVLNDKFTLTNENIDGNTILLNKVLTILEAKGSSNTLDSLIISQTGLNYEEVKKKAREIIENSESNYKMALAYQIENNSEKAIHYYIEALKDSIDFSLRLNILSRLGSLLSLNNYFEDALKYYNEAIKTYNLIKIKDFEDDRIYGNVLNGIGILKMKTANTKKDNEQAIDYLEDAYKNDIRIISVNNQSRNLSLTLQNLTIAYKKVEDFEKAKKMIKEALRIEENIVEINRNSFNLMNLSQVYENYGLLLKVENKVSPENNLTKAFELGLEAIKAGKIEKFEELDLLIENLAHSSYNLGNYYSTAGNYKDADKYFKICEENYLKIHNKNNEKYSFNIASCLISQAAVCSRRIMNSNDFKYREEQRSLGLKLCSRARKYLSIYNDESGEIGKSKDILKNTEGWFKNLK